ncbi:type II toxin-antitoxin system VapC family toxin [Paludisphaera rhizosphaerae]|uniref:type II toxin-antitoxin system VapC family toxin n=1 Tax=Paludisphaera rhizosphaerae TaxID=2711216 RepID=UPI0013EA0FD3|nr:type II toxin-antitoxin system VapC family toxin [Paludisphaera rhizosphaerae]
MFILDTDHFSFLQQVHSTASSRLRARLQEQETSAAVTIISLEEQSRGWLAYIKKARNLDAQVDAYARLRRMHENFCRVPILDFDDMAAVEYGRLKRSFPRTGSMDLKIAAIAITREAVLLTRNRADFDNIPGLMIDDWSV